MYIWVVGWMGGFGRHHARYLFFVRRLSLSASGDALRTTVPTAVRKCDVTSGGGLEGCGRVAEVTTTRGKKTATRLPLPAVFLLRRPLGKHCACRSTCTYLETSKRSRDPFSFWTRREEFTTLDSFADSLAVTSLLVLLPWKRSPSLPDRPESHLLITATSSSRQN